MRAASVLSFEPTALAGSLMIASSCSGVKELMTALGASFGLVPIVTGTAVLEGAGLSAAWATSKLASNALMEFLTPTPPRSIAEMNSARSNGSAPDPAIAPKSAEEDRKSVV